MKRLTTALCLFVFSTLNTFSQNNSFGTDFSEIRKNKNHLELDVKNIFFGLGLENVFASSLLYKRTFQRGELIDVNSIQLVRFLGRINNQITFADDPASEPYDTTNVQPTDLFNFQLGIGFERQKMNKNFVHYYGVDGIIDFLKSDDNFSNVSIGGTTNKSNDRFIRTIRTGVNPFFGIKYYFSSRISIGIETGVSILYFNQSITEVGFEQKIVNGQLEKVLVKDEPSKSQGIWTGFNNLRFLTIGYTF